MDTSNFFDTLFSDAPADAWLTIWSRQSKLTHYYPATPQGYAEAAQDALILDNQAKDVYFGVALRKDRLSSDRRGSLKDIAGIPGFWADVDCHGGTHAAQELPTKEEALALIRQLPCPPSIIVDSGGGLHAYWLLGHVWVLPDGTTEGQIDFFRHEGATRVNRFQTALRALFTERGWKLDSTADLARVLRVPDTHNWKDPAHPLSVEVMPSEFKRYALQELDQWVESVLPPACNRSDGQTAPKPETMTDINSDGIVEAVLEFWTKDDRHTLAMALAGFLGKRGVPEETATEIVGKLSAIKKDDESKDRLRAVKDTYRKLAAGERVAGLSRMPEALALKLNELLPPPDPVSAILGDLGEPPEWPRLFEIPFLIRLASMKNANFQRLMAQIRAKGGSKVISIRDLKSAVNQQRANDFVGGAQAKSEVIGMVGTHWPGAPQETHGMRVPRGFVLNSTVVQEVVTKRGETYAVDITTSPLIVSSLAIDVNSGKESLELAFLRCRSVVRRIIPRDICFSSKKILDYAADGLPIVPGEERGLTKYLGRFEAENRDFLEGGLLASTTNRCGWHVRNGEAYFALPSGTISASGNDAIKLSAQGETGIQLTIDIGVRGSIEAEATTMERSLTMWPRLAWVVGHAAATPLLRPLAGAGALDVNGYVYETVSDQTGRTKSGGLRLAYAPWGSPRAVRLLWGTTLGVLRYIEARSDLPVPMQEAQADDTQHGMGKNAISIAQVIHSIADGGTKLQGAKEGGTKAAPVLYATLLLANNDTCLPDKARQGERVRVLSTPPLVDYDPAIVGDIEAMEEGVAANHGNGGRKLLEYLIAQSQGKWNQLEVMSAELYQQAYDKVVGRIPTDINSEVAAILRRQGKLVATGLVGLILLLRHGYGLSESVIRTAVNGYMVVWTNMIQVVSGDMVPDWQIYLGHVASLIRQNLPRVAGFEIHRETKEGTVTVASMQGYIGATTEINGVQYIGIDPSWLGQELDRRYRRPLRILVKAWLREGIIAPGDKDHPSTRKVQYTDVGTDKCIRPWMVCFKAAALQLDEAVNSDQDADSDDCPF